MLGKTNLRMNKKEEAKLWLRKAVNCTRKTVDDEQVCHTLVLYYKSQFGNTMGVGWGVWLTINWFPMI
jgi:hypothetical protein